MGTRSALEATVEAAYAGWLEGDHAAARDRCSYVIGGIMPIVGV